MIYGVDPPGGLRIVPLDALTAIYHRASGQTHVVAQPIPEILEALRNDDLTLTGFIEALDLPDTSATRMLLSERLDELVATGIVRIR